MSHRARNRRPTSSVFSARAPQRPFWSQWITASPPPPTRLSGAKLICIGGLFLASVCVWHGSVLAVADDNIYLWLLGQILGAVGVGSILPTLTSWTIAGLPSAETARALAVATTLRQLGGAVGVATTLAVLGTPPFALSDFRTLYIAIAMCGLLISALAWREKTLRASSLPSA
jgi:MFS family permease